MGDALAPKLTPADLTAPYQAQSNPTGPEYGAPPAGAEGYAEGLSWGEKFIKQGQSALEGSPFGLPGSPGYITRQYQEDRLHDEDLREGVPPLGVDELNAKYSDMPAKFTEPTLPRVAEFQHNNYVRSRQRQQEIDLGEHELGTLGRIGAGFASVADPANALLMAASGGGTSILGVYTKNVALMASTEIPGYFAKQHEHLNPSAVELATGVFGGAAIGTAAHYAVPYIVKRQTWRETNQVNRFRAAKLAAKQAAEGKVVDTGSVDEHQKFERAGWVGDRQPSDPGTGNPVHPYTPEPELLPYQKEWFVPADNLDHPVAVQDGQVGIGATASRESANNLGERGVVSMGLKPEAVVVSSEDLLSAHPKLLTSAASALETKEALFPTPEGTTGYHGTRRDYAEFDFTKSGGLVHLAKTPGEAAQYATGAGGNRGQAAITQSWIISHDNGIVYELTDPVFEDNKPIRLSDGKILPVKGKKVVGGTFTPVGIASDQDPLIRRENLSPLTEAQRKENPPIDYHDFLDQHVNDQGLTEGFDIQPKNARIISHDLAGKKILDAKSAEGLKVIAGLDKAKAGSAAYLINEAKYALENNHSGQFHGNFWSATKYAKQNPISGLIDQLKEKGYQGIHFRDDMHDTVAIFTPGAAIDGSASVGDLVNQLAEKTNSPQDIAAAAHIFKAAGIDAVHYPDQPGIPASLQVFNPDAVSHETPLGVDHEAKLPYQEPDISQAKSLLEDPEIDAKLAEVKKSTYLNEAEDNAKNYTKFVGAELERLSEEGSPAEKSMLKRELKEIDDNAQKERIAKVMGQRIIDCETAKRK